MDSQDIKPRISVKTSTTVIGENLLRFTKDDLILILKRQDETISGLSGRLEHARTLASDLEFKGTKEELIDRINNNIDETINELKNPIADLVIS